jgi:hypothetical protein
VPAALAEVVLPVGILKAVVAAALFAFGLYRVLRHRHPRWGGMQVGFRDLTIWSFLVAWAHGAGFMLLPILLGMSSGTQAGAPRITQHHLHMNATGSGVALVATLIHTLGYLVVTGLVAWVVYAKLGVGLLRTAWLNLDLLWALALIVTGGITLLV